MVAHNAVPEAAKGVERNLHMPPSVIGEIAATAKVKRLVLSQRMNRTLGREAESKRYIRAYCRGPLVWPTMATVLVSGGKSKASGDLWSSSGSI